MKDPAKVREEIITAFYDSFYYKFNLWINGFMDLEGLRPEWEQLTIAMTEGLNGNQGEES